MRSLVTVLTIAAALALSTPATADDKSKALFRYEAGKSALVRGKLDEAIAAFRDAHGVLNTPNTALSLASALEKKGEHAEALSIAKAGKDLPKGPKEGFGTVKARADLEKLTTKLEAKVGETKPKDPEPTPPAEPAKPAATAASEAATAPAKPVADAPPAKKPVPPAEGGGAGGATVTALVGFSAFAFGAGLGLGAFFTSNSKLDDLEASCPDGTCATFAESEYQSARTTQKLAYVGFAVGGAGLVSGIIGAALAGATEGKKAAASGRPQVSVGLGTVEVRGSF